MKTKNKIIVISIIALTFVIVFSLGFAFFNNLASIETMIHDNFPDVFDTDFDSHSETETDFKEDSTENSDAKKYVSIDLEILTLNYTEVGAFTDHYTTIKRSFEVGSEYSLDIPYYSSQGFYCLSDYKINGIADEDKTIKLLYTDEEMNNIYEFPHQADPNSFNIKIAKDHRYVFSDGEFFKLTNNTDDVFVNPDVCFWSLSGDKLEYEEYVCFFTLEGYSLEPGESILLFPSSVSYDCLTGKTNHDEGFMVLGVKEGNSFYTYESCQKFEIAMNYFMNQN